MRAFTDAMTATYKRHNSQSRAFVAGHVFADALFAWLAAHPLDAREPCVYVGTNNEVSNIFCSTHPHACLGVVSSQCVQV